MVNDSSIGGSIWGSTYFSKLPYISRHIRLTLWGCVRQVSKATFAKAKAGIVV